MKAMVTIMPIIIPRVIVIMERRIIAVEWRE
jgi:hypothetical protein